MRIDGSITYQPKLAVILVGDKCPQPRVGTPTETRPVEKIHLIERDFQNSKHHLLRLATIRQWARWSFRVINSHQWVALHGNHLYRLYNFYLFSNAPYYMTRKVWKQRTSNSQKTNKTFGYKQRMCIRDAPIMLIFIIGCGCHFVKHLYYNHRSSVAFVQFSVDRRNFDNGLLSHAPKMFVIVKR